MTPWEREQQEYLQRKSDSLDAAEILFVAMCVASFIAIAKVAIEWVFGMFP